MSLSYGSSKREQRRELRQATALGSSAIAQGEVTITARGDEAREGSGDIRAQGVLIEAGSVRLDAADELMLQSAENQFSDDSSSQSSSRGIGVSIDSNGRRLSLNAGRSRGEIKQSNDQYLEPQISARNIVAISTAGDTRLEGAQVSGERITAEIGGDLAIIS